jgi:hypothetical protein
MRSRTLSALLLVILLGSLALPQVASAATVLAQQEGTENENAEGGEESEGEGQSDADAETGAGEEEAEGAAEEEEGPPWTYQMARISILLILFFLLGMGLLYYKLIGSRGRSTTG